MPQTLTVEQLMEVVGPALLAGAEVRYFPYRTGQPEQGERFSFEVDWPSACAVAAILHSVCRSPGSRRPDNHECWEVTTGESKMSIRLYDSNLTVSDGGVIEESW